MSEAVWKSLSSVIKERFTTQRLREHQERLKTGCDGLDEALGGGICPGLIVLGGSPGVGKSTFSIQIAESIAKQVPVLYFSMEMTRERIAAKLISRYLFLKREELRAELGLEKCLTADELISGMPEKEPWPPETVQAIERARDYEESVLERLFIIAEPLSASKISEAVESFIEQNGGPLPLVMVDYLQILPPENNRSWNEKQAVEESLKQMAQLAKKNIPVILISSLSRGSYKVPMQIDSFKETGGIEYSADVLLGLQFQACHEKNMDLNAEKDKTPRRVELSILKQRYGKSGSLVPLAYYSAYDCLKEEPKKPEAREEPEVRGAPEEYLDFPVAGYPEETGAAVLDGLDIPTGAVVPSDIQVFIQQEPSAGVPGQGACQDHTAAGENKKNVPRCVMCNTKIANEIRQGTFGFGIQCEVFSGACTEYDLQPEPLSCYDCDVADAIYTLLSKYERESFSIGQILRVLSGDGQQTLTKQKKEDITNSVERLRNTTIAIRCEEEMRQRKEKKPQSEFMPISFQGKFLSVRKEENGRHIRYYFDKDVEHIMPLYAYGETTSQMITFPKALLYVHGNGRKLSDTRETICIKHYLIRRLEILRNKRKRKDGGFHTISFRDDRELAALLKLYDRFTSRESRSQKRRKLRTAVLQILAYYKQIGYIQDYQAFAQKVEIIGSPKDPWKLPELCSASETTGKNRKKKP